VQIGGASGIAGHITVCDDAIISTMTLISRSVTRPGFYSGIFPSMENAQWERAAAVVRQLPELRKRVRELERQVAAARGQAAAAGAGPTPSGNPTGNPPADRAEDRPE
jgi:UDP-3-O-[3-hydroxymyristoyl] glucosamine N-acyltransferase